MDYRRLVVLLEGCTGDGFLINDASKILCVECTARDNDVNGFNIFGSSTILLERCCAFANGTDINIDAASSNVQVIETCANTIDNASSTTTIIDLITVDAEVKSALEILKCESRHSYYSSKYTAHYYQSWYVFVVC